MSNGFRLRKRLLCALVALSITFVLFAGMCALSGVSPGTYAYPSYLLQAQAWLRGHIALDRNYDFLELAYYNGRYYVSFPPVPAIPMVLWTLIWGDDVPGGLFQKIYAAIACLVILSALLYRKRELRGSPREEFDRAADGGIRAADCVAWAIYFTFGSALLPITLVGGVWFEAQILAFLFSVSAVALMQRGRPTLSCLLYALAVGCRPFSVCLGPVLLMMYLRRERDLGGREKLRRLAPGLALGLCVAAAYAVYNYVRFGNIFEFGHNYLPEFLEAEHGQLSLHYVADNWRTLFFGSPIALQDNLVTIESNGVSIVAQRGSRIAFNEFGFSMFLSCPILICNVVWLISDLAKHRFTREKLVILLMGALNVFLLLMHHTLGAHQFGLRYALELVPLCFAYLLLSPERRRIAPWEVAVMTFGLAFNFIGGCLVHV